MQLSHFDSESTCGCGNFGLINYTKQSCKSGLLPDLALISAIMKRNKLLIVFTAIVLFAGVSYLIGSISGENNTYVRALDEIPESFERKIKEHNLQFGFLNDTSKIYSPAQVRIDKEYLYVNDFSDFTIYKYDLMGNLINTVETIRGRGPGEVQHITDFDVRNDTLWIVDSQSMRAISYSVDTGENIHNYILEHRPNRIACLSDGFVVQWMGADSLFSKFDYNGNEIAQFGDIIENQYQHPISLDGTIRSNKDDRFVYIPFYASLIYHYTSNGDLINILKAPDGVQFPAARREGATTFAPDFSFMRDGYIDPNDNLYVYTRVPRTDNENSEVDQSKVSYLDKYDLTKADYVESILLEAHFTSLMYHPNAKVIYATDMEKIYVKKLSKSF